MGHNRPRTRPTRGKKPKHPSLLKRINRNAAGIDCGSETHFVAVPPERDSESVRSFKTFTGDLHRLADWLDACKIKTVAMESTGVYWIPIFEILEEHGFEVVLVNSRHVKNVPGRKSDVLDCQWIQELHSVGLLRGSFRPAAEIVSLRAYLRHRGKLVEGAASHIRRMQKVLVQMNLLLHNGKRLRKGVLDFLIEHRFSRLFGEPLFPQSRRQRLDVAHGMIVDSLQHVDQVNVRIYAM